MFYPKLFIGPVSRNTVDAAINVANSKNVKLGLIPSRRQADFSGGYINWTTAQFSEYVRSKTSNILLERDHGGSNQGQVTDHGVISFLEDVKYLDIIHVDPFKSWNNILEVANETVIHLQYLHSQNQNVFFEIGTEYGIMPYTTEQYKQFLDYVWNKIDDKLKDKILYLVVQGGTEVKEGKNIGISNSGQLVDFIRLCNSYGKLSKEHNGDYLNVSEITQKFQLGLSAINIAPEFGTIESDTLWSNFNEQDQDRFFKLAVNSKKWQKWFKHSFNPEKNKELLVKMCGHYVFEHPDFQDIKLNYHGIDQQILINLEFKINSILEEVL